MIVSERKAGIITRTCEGKVTEIEVTITLRKVDADTIAYIVFPNSDMDESLGVCSPEKFEQESNHEILEYACSVQNTRLGASIPAGCELGVHPDKRFRVKEVY